MHEVAKKQLGAEAIANYGPLGNTALTLGCGIVAVRKIEFRSGLTDAGCRRGRALPPRGHSGTSSDRRYGSDSAQLSRINKGTRREFRARLIRAGQGGKGSATSKLIRLAKEAGPVGIWSGLGPRIVMTAFLVRSVERCSGKV